MEGVTNNKLKKQFTKKIFLEPPCTGGPKLLHGSIGTYRKTKKMKILIMYRLWSKYVPMNLKRTPMTFKI